MLTITITNRNRDLRIVKNCLNSLAKQSSASFGVTLVDYGSEAGYLSKLKDLVKQYPFINLIHCETQHQLWNKSRAINIALKQCETPYFLVGDIDMIYHPDFITKLFNFKLEGRSIYFQVGFLSEAESKKNKSFFDYHISFKSTKEATGMTLYKTEDLNSINGYDEFYNGWGSEDTDTHKRLLNANKSVVFYEEELLMLHQWHTKTYRQKNSVSQPFHSNLEKINEAYLRYTIQTHKVLANTKFYWGVYKENDCVALKHIDVSYSITNELSDVKGFLNAVLLNLESNKIILVSVRRHHEYKTLKHQIKKLLGKKLKVFLLMQEVNDLILEHIIMHCRNSSYKYTFNIHTQEIELVIKLKS